MENKLLLLLTITLFNCLTAAAQTPVLWGMAISGGQQNNGLIFNLNAATDVFTDVHDFTGGNDGLNPAMQCGLMRANNGLLYAVTGYGGVDSLGAIVSYDMSTGIETPLYSFGTNSNDGTSPCGKLIQASNGLLYGTTSGLYGNHVNTIFSYNIQTGVETTLHKFASNVGSDGYEPIGSMLQVNDSLLYGFTVEGGPSGDGTIFNYNINSGKETVVYSFSGPDGSLLWDAPIMATDGKLYGTAQTGGANTYWGVIFSYDIATGVEAVVHSFGIGADGASPLAGLYQANNGLLYGTTREGGIHNRGTLFSYDISNSNYYKLHDFGNNDADGDYVVGSVIQANNGLLYGMTAFGGADSIGTIYSYDIAKDTLIVLHNFTFSPSDGNAPYGDLFEFDSLNISASPLSSNICAGEPITLKAMGAVSYTWSPAAGLNTTTGDSVIANPTVATTYTVTGATKGLQGSVKTIITVLPAPNKPIITVSVTGDSLISSATSDNQWYFDGSAITDSTRQVLVIKGHAKGWFSVTVTNEANGCSTTSDSTTAVNQLSVISNQLSIYPNPTSSSVFIKINSATLNVNDWSLQLFDVLGRTLYTEPSLNYSNEINLSHLPGGVYFITVVNKTGRAVFKVVKEN